MRRRLGALKEDFTQGISETSRIQVITKISQTSLKDSILNPMICLNHQVGNSKLRIAIFALQFQEVEEEVEALELGSIRTCCHKDCIVFFCGENKGPITKSCHITIQKQKELIAVAQTSQSQEIYQTSSYYSLYIPQHVKPKSQPLVSIISPSPQSIHWGVSQSYILGSPPYEQLPSSHPQYRIQDSQQYDKREPSKPTQ